MRLVGILLDIVWERNAGRREREREDADQVTLLMTLIV